MSVTHPTQLYTAEQSRAVDRCAIEQHGLPSGTLMARAARAAFELLLAHNPAPGLLQVICGPGNNGGDGLLLAVLGAARGIATRVLLVDGEPRSDDARRALAKARAAGIPVEPFDAGTLEPRGVVVDAMLGTGVRGALREAYCEAIAAVNAAGAPVLSLDLPSGIDSDSGAAAAQAIVANWTISFITPKRGLYTAAGAEHAGVLSVDDLGVPAAAYQDQGPTWECLALATELGSLPRRTLVAHKGQFGRLLLIGGDHGMGGAIILAAEAALTTGVGLARVATRAEHLAPLLARLPECMVSAVDHRNALATHLAWADVVVLGPGLGLEPWGEQMLHATLAAGKATLFDADALNLLARNRQFSLPEGSVVTPHPGEAGRLLVRSGTAVQRDRFTAAQELAQQMRAAVVLKGNGSLVAAGDQLGLCSQGNPGMASPGMGDVLSGVIGGLLAQGLSAAAAARLGTVLHACAGDQAAISAGYRALRASDLIAPLGELLR